MSMRGERLGWVFEHMRRGHRWYTCIDERVIDGGFWRAGLSIRRLH